MESYAQVLCQSLLLLLLVILHRRSRFFGYISQTISSANFTFQQDGAWPHISKATLDDNKNMGFHLKNEKIHGCNFFWSNAKTTFYIKFDSFLTLGLEYRALLV